MQEDDKADEMAHRGRLAGKYNNVVVYICVC